MIAGIASAARPNGHAGTAGDNHVAARQRLASTITRQSAALARLRRIEDQQPKVHQKWLSAANAVDAAETALDQARKAEPRWLTQIAIGALQDTGNPVAEGETRLAAATAARDLALKLEDALQRELAEGERELAHATHDRDSAIATVLLTSRAVTRLLDDLAVARRHLHGIEAAIRRVQRAGGLPHERRYWQNDEYGVVAPDFDPEPLALFESAIEMLASDSDTRLPD